MATFLENLTQKITSGLSASADAAAKTYQKFIGQPTAQILGGGARGYFGLDVPAYADQLGQEAYKTGQALGNAPMVGMPAGAVKGAVYGLGALGGLLTLMSGAKAGDKAFKGAAGTQRGMFVPAFAIKTLGEVKKAEKLINQGKVEEAWKQYGIYQDPADRLLKSVVSDAPATVRPEAVARGDVIVTKNKITGKDEYSLIGDYTRTYLENKPPVTAQELFYHPDLYRLVPEIAQAKIKGGGLPGTGSYSAAKNEIWLGGGESLQDFVSTFLHEAAGHGAQYKYSMASGGSPEMFIADEKTFYGAQQTLNDALKMLRLPPGSKEAVPESVKNTLTAYKDVLQDAEKIAGDYYFRLPGEAAARTIQKMYENPALAGENPLNIMNAELLSKLKGPATTLENYTLVPKVDTLPEVKAITDNLDILYDNLLKGWGKP